MATDSRTLKLSILADVDNLRKGLKKAEGDLKSFGDFTSGIGKKIELAFKLAAAAAGAYAIKIAVDGVRAALEDEAAQIRLANALEATTTATQGQIEAVENYISQAALATGVADDDLRPAFQSLAGVTNDLTQAQKLLNLALEISAGTGLPLDRIVRALTLAYDGNFASLDKLLPQISKTDIAGKSAAEVFELLEGIFAGSIQANSESLAFKQAQLAIAFGEVKESLGFALLPILERFTDWLITEGIPLLEAFVGGLTGQRSLKTSLTDSQKAAERWGEIVRNAFKTVWNYRDELLQIGAIILGMFVVSKIAAAVTATIAIIRGLISVYNTLKASALMAGIAAAFALNPLAGVAAAAIAGAVMFKGVELLEKIGASDTKTTGPLGNFQMSTGTVLGAPKPVDLSVGTITGGAKAPKKVTKVPDTPLFGGSSVADWRRAEEASVNNYINVSTVADSEATAAAIVEVLQNSSRRGGAGLYLTQQAI